MSTNMAHTGVPGSSLLDFKSGVYLALLAVCLVVIQALGRVST